MLKLLNLLEYVGIFHTMVVRHGGPKRAYNHYGRMKLPESIDSVEPVGVQWVQSAGSAQVNQLNWLTQ